MFSSTTMELSTIMPTPMAIPPMLIMFSVRWHRFISRNTDRMQTGMEMAMVMVALQRRRNRYTTMAASSTPRMMFCRAECTTMSMKSEARYTLEYRMLRFSAWSSAILAATFRAVECSLAPDCLDTCSSTQLVPSTLAMESLSLFSSTTSATSPRRTVPPVGRARIMSATSSTLRKRASVLTVRVLEPFCISPPGYNRFSAARN